MQRLPVRIKGVVSYRLEIAEETGTFQERQRIGRDLHDTLHQELTGIGMLRVTMLP